MNNFGRKNYTLDEARSRMERYCAYQERCHQEVEHKLREMRMIPEAIDSIIVHLIEQNFLNEERFALEFTRGRFNQKSWGPHRLQLELRQRGITDYLIRKALDSIPESKRTIVFEELASRRLASLQGETGAKLRQKLYNYLYYRGWESERISNFMSRALPG